MGVSKKPIYALLPVPFDLSSLIHHNVIPSRKNARLKGLITPISEGVCGVFILGEVILRCQSEITNLGHQYTLDPSVGDKSVLSLLDVCLF